MQAKAKVFSQIGENTYNSLMSLSSASSLRITVLSMGLVGSGRFIFIEKL
jgi:hypothetical protein